MNTKLEKERVLKLLDTGSVLCSRTRIESHSNRVWAAITLLTVFVINTHAQPWQTVYQGPGRVYATVMDPFPNHPQPSLFFGGYPNAGASVQWAGPLGIVGTPPMAFTSDSEPNYLCND